MDPIKQHNRTKWIKQLIGSVRKIELAMGDGKKKILEEEKEIAKNLGNIYKFFFRNEYRAHNSGKSGLI